MFTDCASSFSVYTALPVDDPEVSTINTSEASTLLGNETKSAPSLTAADKWRLLKPMIFKYMLPLCKSLRFFYTHQLIGLGSLCLPGECISEHIRRSFMLNVCYSMSIPSTRYTTLSTCANRDSLILIRPPGYRSDASVSSTFSRPLRFPEQDYTLH